MITCVETEEDEVYYKPILKRTDLSPVSPDKILLPCKSLTIVVVITLFLANCASQTPSKTKLPREHAERASTVAEQSARDYLALAAKADPEQAIGYLVNASEQWLIEQNYSQALWLANETAALPVNDPQRYQLALVKAGSLFNLERFDQAYEQLQQGMKLLEQTHTSPASHHYLLLAAIQQARHFSVEALTAKLTAFSLTPTATEDEVVKLWQELNQLSYWQFQQLSRNTPPEFKGWQQLLNYAQQSGDNREKFAGNLSRWQHQYPNHRANIIIPLLAKHNAQLTVTAINNIAVILPLTGNQQAAGIAAQQGILSAYQNDATKQLFFLDANTLDMSTLSTTLAELAIDYVIGPLLKENVDRYLAQQELNVPTLLLNLPGATPLKPHQQALSMRPEDEAIQAASTLSKQNFNYPMVISYNDNVSQRIAQEFTQQWYAQTGITPPIFYFDAGSEMQVSLEASLEVDKSEQRIDELTQQVKQAIKTETRNRRDIDMIYLVGSPSQTRLLKPYIDVYTSPFADIIPVFASSKSHSALQDRKDTRDLRELTFTEMPWLLSSTQQDKALTKLSMQLWPERSDSLQRIFAMGFDSLALVEKLPKMQQANYLRHFGQTGIWQLNQNNILTRSLIWGKYQQDKVAAVAME